jgi:hypothetical protein
MKKITMWLFLLIGFISYSQINISQDFPTTTTPAGWGLGGGSLTTTQSCASASWRFNVYGSSSTTTNTLSSETFVSTGEQLNVSFDYKVVDWSAATVATTPYNGTIIVETSSDNGVSYGNPVVAVNNGNHTVANTCATKSVIIPGSNVPGGANTKIRIKCNFGTSGDYYVYLDNVVITQAAAPTCAGTPAPGNTIFPSPICAGASATLSLQNYTPGAGVTYQWYKDAVAILSATSVTYVIPSVTTTNSYYCEVTCAGNTTASSTVVVGPTVLNAPTTVETFATFLPTCWLFGDNGDLTTGPATYGTNGWKNDGFANVGSTGSIAYNHYTTGANDWIVSPVINIPATGYELKFDASLTQWNGTGAPTTAWDAGDVVEVLISSTGLNNWTPIYTIDSANSPAAAGSSIAVDLDTYATQNIRIAYRVVSGATDGGDDTDIFIDNFQIRLSPTCPDQTGLVVSNITSSGADTSWDDMSANGSVGYQYAVTTSATPPASGTPTTSTFYIASGLTSQTLHYLHVRSECASSTFGNWASIPFTTACSPVTSFIQNFDAVTTPALPTCWSKAFSGASTFATVTTATTNASAPNGVNMYNDNSGAAANIMLVTPTLSNLSAGTHRLKFKARNNSATQDLEIGVLTDPADATTFTLVQAVDITTTFQSYVVNFDTFTAPGAAIALRRLSTSTFTNVYVDDVVWEAMPTCPDQTGLVVGNITSSGADTSWDDLSGSGVTGYEYAVTTSATPPASGTPTTATFYIASGLAPQTVHYLHVRTDCGAGSYGIWISIPFTTTCVPLVALPWTENFDALTPGTNVFPTCWNYSNTTNTWSISTTPTAFSGANSLRRTWSTDGWAFTPMFTLAAGTSYTFSYYVRTQDTTVGYDVTVGVGTSQSSVAMTNTLSTVVGYQGPTWTLVNLEFTPTVSGDYSFGVHVVAPVAPNGINFDDFELKLTPACPAPIASVSNVTSATANISWAAVASATLGYEYVLDNVATDPAGSGTPIMTITYPASGLTASTVYYFHIRSVCSAGTYSAWSTISFTTLATPPANDNCATATVLTPGPLYTSNPVATTNVGATNSNPPAPGCASFAGGDVWFSVVVPASGNISLETITGTVTDTGLAVYSGTCAGLTLIDCDDDSATNVGSNSLIELIGRTPGETLYVNAWEFGNNSFGTFSVTAYDAALSAVSFDTTSFVAYPNPVKDVLNLSYKTVINNVRVVNLLGQEVLNSRTNSNDIQVNMSALTAGAYIVNITVEDTVHTIKIIKE